VPAVRFREVAQAAPRRELRLPQRLGQPHVADPGDDRLVEQRLAEPARLIGAAHPFEDRVEPRRALEDVRPEVCERAQVQLEHGTVPQNSFNLVAAQHEPRLSGAHLATRSHRPAARHPQVGAEDDAALEAQDEVLAVGVHRLQRSSVDPLGNALGPRAWVGRFGRDSLADEHLQAARRQMERIALGHVSQRSGSGHSPSQSPVIPSLNIAALTQRTGVPSDTIRKWEQRYGVLHPERTAGGQRRYSELDVARVNWLKERIHEGYRIGEAAALLGDGDQVARTVDELRDGIVAATAESDVDALGQLVDQALAVPTLEESFAHVLTPALVEVGERWAAGILGVAQEHLVSSTVRAALHKLLSDQRAAVHGTAVLACGPGEQHEIGLMMLAVLLRSDGWQVAYLGADTPFEDAVALADRLEAAALCFSAASKQSARALDRALAKTPPRPSLAVLVGGGGTKKTDARDAVARLRKLAA
jgi:MerR family transcriptional regulator, light-induced transcriptional regulator